MLLRHRAEKRYFSAFMTPALDGGDWSTSFPGRFTSGKDPLPIGQEALWASGPVWTGTEGLASTPPIGLKRRTTQPIASRYTDYAILATLRLFIFAGNNTSIYTTKKNREVELVATKHHALADYVHVT
jgi:hypothetical protein